MAPAPFSPRMVATLAGAFNRSFRVKQPSPLTESAAIVLFSREEIPCFAILPKILRRCETENGIMNVGGLFLPHRGLGSEVPPARRSWLMPFDLRALSAASLDIHAVWMNALQNTLVHDKRFDLGMFLKISG